VEEIDVARKVAEQSEEVCVPRERVAQRAGLISVVPADALGGRSNRSLILGWKPRAPLIVILPSTRTAGKTIMPPIV
jgi:hypothetical protein